MSKTTIDLERLRQSKLVSNEVFKDQADLQEEVDRKRKKREEAKLEIIRKINEDVTPIKKTNPINQLEPIAQKQQKTAIKKDISLIKPLTNIKVIKSDNKSNETKIKETKERLSYTLQMDTISQNQISAYRSRKKRKEFFDINNKFIDLEPKITRIYIITIIFLLLFISSTLLINQFLIKK